MNDALLEQFKNYSILCVEDEDLIRDAIVSTLKFYFKEVYESSNAQDAYEKYLDYKPDIILSDIQMPKENGISLVERIRANDLDSIIIMVTAYSSQEYLLDLINLNINHYVLKPVTSDNLLNGIIKAFGDRLDKKLHLAKDLYFDLKTYQLTYLEEKIVLRKRDIDFLLLLYKNKNQVVSYSLIEDTLWRDKHMSTSALKTFIKEFRQRIPIDLLQNVHQIGYKLKD